VFFTKPWGARKLAHYAEREITRLLASRSAPIEVPLEPGTPDISSVKPGQPPPRPLAGPIVPLVAASVSSDQLLGGPGSRPAPVDALAARTLVKGEPLAAPAGRADDFVWPRREVGREQAKGDTPMASVTPGAVGPDGVTPVVTPPAPPKPRKLAPVKPTGPTLGGFFSFQSPSPPPPPQQQAPARPRLLVPRPPGNIGPSASVPGFFAR
jgi:hypothetical protein